MTSAIHVIHTPVAKAMLLLDTSALVDLEWELNAGRVGPIRSYLGRKRAEDVACSTISIGELATGRNEEHATRAFLRRLRKIAPSEAIAYRAAELDEALIGKGQRLGENDTWIAATAIHCSATLVYTDGDFDRVTWMKRERPRSGL
jgi:predicted nucleic acid-binding protein